MFNKSKTNNGNLSQDAASDPGAEGVQDEVEVEAEQALEQPVVSGLPATPPTPRNSMMEMITTTATKPSILSEGFSFRGEIAGRVRFMWKVP